MEDDDQQRKPGNVIIVQAEDDVEGYPSPTPICRWCRPEQSYPLEAYVDYQGCQWQDHGRKDYLVFPFNVIVQH